MTKRFLALLPSPKVGWFVSKRSKEASLGGSGQLLPSKSGNIEFNGVDIVAPGGTARRLAELHPVRGVSPTMGVVKAELRIPASVIRSC